MKQENWKSNANPLRIWVPQEHMLYPFHLHKSNQAKQNQSWRYTRVIFLSSSREAANDGALAKHDAKNRVRGYFLFSVVQHCATGSLLIGSFTVGCASTCHQALGIDPTEFQDELSMTALIEFWGLPLKPSERGLGLSKQVATPRTGHPLAKSFWTLVWYFFHPLWHCRSASPWHSLYPWSRLNTTSVM